MRLGRLALTGLGDVAAMICSHSVRRNNAFSTWDYCNVCANSGTDWEGRHGSWQSASVRCVQSESPRRWLQTPVDPVPIWKTVFRFETGSYRLLEFLTCSEPHYWGGFCFLATMARGLLLVSIAANDKRSPPRREP